MMNIILVIADRKGNEMERKEIASVYLEPVIRRENKDVSPQKLILLGEEEVIVAMELSCDRGKFERKVPRGKMPAEFEEICFSRGWVPVATDPEGNMRQYSYETGEWQGTQPPEARD